MIKLIIRENRSTVRVITPFAADAINLIGELTRNKTSTALDVHTFVFGMKRAKSTQLVLDTDDISCIIQRYSDRVIIAAFIVQELCTIVS